MRSSLQSECSKLWNRRFSSGQGVSQLFPFKVQIYFHSLRFIEDCIAMQIIFLVHSKILEFHIDFAVQIIPPHSGACTKHAGLVSVWNVTALHSVQQQYSYVRGKWKSWALIGIPVPADLASFYRLRSNQAPRVSILCRRWYWAGPMWLKKHWRTCPEQSSTHYKSWWKISTSTLLDTDSWINVRCWPSVSFQRATLFWYSGRGHHSLQTFYG